MKLREILQHKGAQVHSASPDDSLGDVVGKLVAKNCGALVVLEGSRIAGIISERDVLRACAELKQPLEALVRNRMTSELVTTTPDDDLEHVMGLMTNHRIRHLPVLESGELKGVVSIGDIVKAQHSELSYENRVLKQYIQG
ncbi:MAG TPA: CBS domain-containing protein [Arenicellales bacterium]|nr:CBS domain-containing protein [Arenicellales bacterium]